MRWLFERLLAPREQTSRQQQVKEMEKRTEEAVARAQRVTAEMDQRRQFVEAERRSYGRSK